jgi:hypothetical protein
VKRVQNYISLNIFVSVVSYSQKMAKMEKNKKNYHGSSQLLRRDHNLEVLRDLPHALMTLFSMEEFNPKVTGSYGGSWWKTQSKACW